MALTFPGIDLYGSAIFVDDGYYKKVRKVGSYLLHSNEGMEIYALSLSGKHFINGLYLISIMKRKELR